MFNYPKIVNDRGEEVLLTQREALLARNLEVSIKNALGYEIPITTLTTVMKSVSEQKFFQVAPADYLPVRVGNGAWSTALTTFRSFAFGDDFGTGLVNSGANGTRLASADAGVDAITVPVKNWAKSIGWSIMDLEIAAKSGNWDIVSSKEKARKQNWDLGIQRVAFLGLNGDATVPGLLTQPASAGVSTNTSRITKPISAMTEAELKTFCAGIVEDYRANCNRTAMPTHFIVPESDYNGMASMASATFPIKSVLEILLDMFKAITRNAGFQILPLSYCDQAYSGLGAQMYLLLNYEEDSIRMDIPVDYTSTLANSNNNFSFENAAYGQFTGVGLYRPKELLYFRY